MTDRELFLVLCFNQKIIKANAVVLLEGDGFSRLKKACSLINEGWSNTLVFSGGADNPAYGSYTYHQCLPLIIDGGVKKEQIIWESESKHTREQAENVVQICIEKEWSKIILVATHFHQPRAFLTFLKVLEEKKSERTIDIINASAYADWMEETTWGKRIDLLDVEFEKIETYKQSGHISDYKTAIDYFKWSMYQ
jgi:hypothetical protein